jgi:hypothetical protein
VAALIERSAKRKKALKTQAPKEVFPLSASVILEVEREEERSLIFF